MEAQVASAMAQLGAAGLIGWMWLTERRSAAVRDKQLCELHERIMQERAQAAVLQSVISDNTRALTALEVGQRGVASVLERLVVALAAPPRRPEPTAPRP